MASLMNKQVVRNFLLFQQCYNQHSWKQGFTHLKYSEKICSLISGSEMWCQWKRIFKVVMDVINDPSHILNKFSTQAKVYSGIPFPHLHQPWMLPSLLLSLIKGKKWCFADTSLGVFKITQLHSCAGNC